MSTILDVIAGMMIGVGIITVLRATSYAVAARRARRCERIAAEEEQKARVEAEEAIRLIDDRFRANMIASVAALAEHRRTCPCESCVTWRRWEAGRNN